MQEALLDQVGQARAGNRIEMEAGLFRLSLEDGEIVYTHRVVMATGLAKQGMIPWEFQGLSTDLVSHSSEHASFAPFRGQGSLLWK